MQATSTYSNILHAHYADQTACRNDLFSATLSVTHTHDSMHAVRELRVSHVLRLGYLGWSMNNLRTTQTTYGYFGQVIPKRCQS